jgi:hypothetical protein
LPENNYQINSSTGTIHLTTTEIDNLSAYSTGTMRLELWATTKPSTPPPQHRLPSGGVPLTAGVLAANSPAQHRRRSHSPSRRPAPTYVT